MSTDRSRPQGGDGPTATGAATETLVTAGGVTVPAVGLGTWRLTDEACEQAVATALEVGYRHVDTAQAYGNERAVGRALRAAAPDRESVFLTTKLSGGNRAYDAVIESVEASLARLDTAYLDLLLIHQPHDRLPTGPDHAETLRAMDHLVETGKVRHIGVSNFSVAQLHEARQLAEHRIVTNQVQFHPYWDQRRLLDYCHVHDVLVTAYSPLAHGGVLDDPVLAEIGARYDRSPAQVAIRWVLSHPGVVTIPKASTREHLVDNLAATDFDLTPAEIDRIRRPSRLRTLGAFVRNWL